MKLRITLLIPAILVFSAVVSSALMFYYTVYHEEERLRNKTIEQLNLDITRLQNILYNQLTEGKLTDARLNVSMTAMGSTFKKLLILDENEDVIIANRYGWEGSKAADISDYDINIAKAVKSNNQPQYFFEKQNSANLDLYYPVVLKIENHQGLPVKRLGTLFAEISIKRELEGAYNEALQESFIFGSLFLVAAMLMAITLHFKIAKRISYLSKISGKLAEGDFKARANMRGQDEISQLADSFDGMAGQIQTNISELNEARKNLLNLNASLEERVLERTEQLKEAQSIAHLGNWQWNIKTGDVSWSDETFRIFGLQPNEIEPSIDLLLDAVVEEDKELVSTALEKALSEGKQYSLEHQIIRKDGEQRWLYEEGYIHYDDKNKPDVMRGITIDITEQKKQEAERNKLERQLQQSQKMESLGQLTGGIAHDFNNMLASIRGFTELAQQLDINDPSGKLLDYLSYVEKATNRAADLVTQMLAFSRTDSGIQQKETIDITSLLNESVSMLRPILPSSIELTIDTEDNLPKVNINPVMINQVLMNLFVNARDAIKNKQGEINVEARKVFIKQGQCASCHKDIKGEYLEIIVSDTGLGIPENEQFHLFEPFYTTKEVGKGTGMGLAMVHGIMHKHDGHILVDSTVSNGSKFMLLLPVESMGSVDNHETSIYQDNITLNNKTKNILVVDDEVSITLFLKALLESNGYTVFVYNDSFSALKFFKVNHNNIDLVITDYTMPGLTGLQMTHEMHLLVPDLPVILCSGYSEEVDDKSLQEENICEYFDKPIDTVKILDAIKKYSVKTKVA